MSKLLGNLEKGLVFVISAPAGTGKTTLAQMLAKEFSCVTPSISCTTRKPRAGEKEGEHYIFLSVAEFEKRIAAHEFLEYVQLYGDYYGTCQKWVQEQQDQGKHVLLTIDTQGALQLKGHYPAVFIFIKPPSLGELKKRLIFRQTENKERIEERLAWAEKEIEASLQYDYNIVNDNLTVAYEILRSILIAEEHRAKWTTDFYGNQLKND